MGTLLVLTWAFRLGFYLFTRCVRACVVWVCVCCCWDWLVFLKFDTPFSLLPRTLGWMNQLG